MVTIYGLRLVSGKFYVGMTQNKFDRIDAHRRGFGAAWTRKYPPVDYEFVRTGMEKSDEDRLTIELMSKYGVDNVRGGKWVQVVLPKVEYEYLQRKVGEENQSPTEVREDTIESEPRSGKRYTLGIESLDRDRFQKWIRIYHAPSQ